MDAIWLALQHGEKKYRKKYFPLIEKAVENGDLSKEKFAVMTDRMLMDDGEPQLYGSQIRKGKVYKLANPESVNERRKEMGLGSIERYLATFDMKFERDSDQ